MIVGAVRDDANTKAPATKKNAEIKIALKNSVHSQFKMFAAGFEIKNPSNAAAIGTRSAKSPAAASFFCGSPIITFVPAEILNL